jgi:Fe-only nitrogenase accessory protein AnfO
MEPAAIAVVKDSSGALSRFSDDVVIEIYSKQGAEWQCTDRVPFVASASSRDMAAMRKDIRNTALALGSTRILVGKSVSGVAYTILDQLGFRICEMDSFSPQCLDALLHEVEKSESDVPSVLASPVESDVPGHYTFDLTAALSAFPELTSKKILRPFFSDIPFLKLDLTCSHVPPWLTPELERLRFIHHQKVLPGNRVLLEIARFADKPCG